VSDRPKLIRDTLEFDLCDACPAKSEHIGGQGRDVNYSAFHKRTSVVDYEHHGTVVGEVGYPDMGPKRQEAMRTGHLSSCAIIGCLADPALGPRGYASRQQHDKQKNRLCGAMRNNFDSVLGSIRAFDLKPLATNISSAATQRMGSSSTTSTVLAIIQAFRFNCWKSLKRIRLKSVSLHHN
jgi:hypothetical protein